MNLFTFNRGGKKFKVLRIIIGVLIIVSMVLLYSPLFLHGF